MTIYSKSRELLCFGKSFGVPEGPCLLCVEGVFLALDFTSVSISSQQQCLQEAFGLVFLGRGLFLVGLFFGFFFISSALKLLGGKLQSSWRREGDSTCRKC